MRTYFSKGVMEKATLIVSYCGLSMMQTYLTLSIIGMCFKRSKDAVPYKATYNLHEYTQIFGMFEIMYLTAIPYFSTFVFNKILNIVIDKFTQISVTDDSNQTSALSRFARSTVFLGLIAQIWSLLIFTQQNPTGLLQFIGDGKDELLTFNLMVISLVLMGISQSLITMGCHTYLLKAINADVNESGELEDYPFTVNSIHTLGRLKNEGYFIGAFSMSMCLTPYM